MYTCATLAGCRDTNNTNYFDPNLRLHDSKQCDAGTCINGSSKEMLGAGDGSCIKVMDTFVLEKAPTGCCSQSGYDDCKCRFQVAIGKSGWSHTQQAGTFTAVDKYIIAFRKGHKQHLIL